MITLTEQNKLGYVSDVEKRLIDRYNNAVNDGFTDSPTNSSFTIEGKGSVTNLIFPLSVELLEEYQASKHSNYKYYIVYKVDNQLIYIEVYK